MNKTFKRKIIITAICCLMIMVIFSGCNGLNPFNSGIRIKLIECQAEILIKEREHLMGNIAEIYYIDGKEKIY